MHTSLSSPSSNHQEAVMLASQTANDSLPLVRPSPPEKVVKRRNNSASKLTLDEKTRKRREQNRIAQQNFRMRRVSKVKLMNEPT
jgi:hypothetical protein